MSGCHQIQNRKAAKQHRCEECRGVIAKGEIHVVLSGIFENEPYRTRQCIDCAPLFDKINRLHWKNGDEGIPFGAMYEDIFESRDPKEIADYLGVMAKRKAPVPTWMWKRWDEAVSRKVARVV